MSSQPNPAIVLFGADLRLDDNPALQTASVSGQPLICIWIKDDSGRWGRPPGAASRWYLHHSLAALDQSLRRLCGCLILRAGQTEDIICQLAADCKAHTVFWNSGAEPAQRAGQERLRKRLVNSGIEVRSFFADGFCPPGNLLNKQGTPYKVFTPFYKALMAEGFPSTPLDTPKKLRFADKQPTSKRLEDLELLPSIPWDAGLAETWTPGENGARKGLDDFLENAVRDYGHGRDELASDGTSMLSPALRFGEISVRRVWHETSRLHRRVAEPFLRQLVWREFARHLLHHFPETQTEPLNPTFKTFPWRQDIKALKAWQRGQTGFPVVDAGMRQLWQTGWMHNRARMIVASFLVKDLRLHWREGEAWFWDTLVDADAANNILGWQWAAGCGADAAPYFRVFNPTLQGRKFDPAGTYVRRWVPEISAIETRWIQAPEEAPPLELESTGLRLDRDYPHPIVDHARARDEALSAWRNLR